MSKVHIVTDSTADLPAEILKKYNNISVIPLKVIFADKTFRDGVDLSPSQFYNRLAASNELPKTSQPPPGEFLDLYKKITDQDKKIISIHLSSGLSGTFQSANNAKTMLDSTNIEVIDSLSASMGIGLIVLAAADAAKEGWTFNEIVALVKKLVSQSKIYFLVNTLEYLKKGGRIGKAQAFLGTLLNIKPILWVNEGIVYPYEKIRGKAKALKRLVDVSAQEIPPKASVKCSIVHASNLESAQRVKNMFLEKVPQAEVSIAEIGPVIGSHVGPGALGIIFYIQ